MAWSSIPFWEYIIIIFSFFSILLHIFLLFIIIRSRIYNRVGFFSSPFFVICIIQGSQEILMFLVSTFINRCRKYRIIQYEISDDNQIVEWEHYFYLYIRNNLYLAHVFVAINRLSAFYLKTPAIYNRYWNTTTIILLFCAGFVATFLLRAVIYSPSLTVETYIDKSSDIFTFTLNGRAESFDLIVSIVLSVGASIMCFTAYVATSILAKVKLSQMTDNVKNREILLLKVGIATFLMLLPSTIDSLLHTIAYFTNNIDLKVFASRQSTNVTDALYVFQPWILLLTCPPMRRKLRRFPIIGSSFVNYGSNVTILPK